MSGFCFCCGRALSTNPNKGSLGVLTNLGTMYCADSKLCRINTELENDYGF